MPAERNVRPHLRQIRGRRPEAVSATLSILGITCYLGFTRWQKEAFFFRKNKA
jgi:hypothetical protein